MSWFRETNPHFWPSEKPQSPAPPIRQPGPSQQPGQQSPDGIRPGSRIRPRERPDGVESSRAREPNPHHWPREQPHAPVHSSGHPRPVQQPGLQLPGDTQTERRIRPRERVDHVDSPPAREPNPHLWPREQPHAPRHSSGYPRHVQQQGQQLPGDAQPGRRTRPRERPDHAGSTPAREPNPHFWPRDQPPAPVPSSSHTRPVQQPGQQHPGDAQPGKRTRPKERTDHVLPPHAHDPVGSQPQQPQSRPQAHEPELELIPADHHPQRFWPKSQDHSPLHPSQASVEHWPLHPDQASHDGSTHPRPKHKKHPTTSRPPRKHAPPADQGQPPREHNLIYPPPNRTNPCTWFIAIFCVILWVVVILGGILILIIYLFYRPRNPHFEISNASLNAAYLDMGYLLNADLVVLANFTNPNVKMNVDFNFVILKLQYEGQPIATQYINSFSVQKSESKLAAVEMVSSQIRLPLLVTQQLVKQIRKNRVTFQVDGYFHARSRYGSIFRYSYWLYSHCTIVTTGPPSGIMVASKCITKR